MVGEKQQTEAAAETKTAFKNVDQVTGRAKSDGIAIVK